MVSTYIVKTSSDSGVTCIARRLTTAGPGHVPCDDRTNLPMVDTGGSGVTTARCALIASHFSLNTATSQNRYCIPVITHHAATLRTCTTARMRTTCATRHRGTGWQGARATVAQSSRLNRLTRCVPFMQLAPIATLTWPHDTEWSTPPSVALFNTSTGNDEAHDRAREGW